MLTQCRASLCKSDEISDKKLDYAMINHNKSSHPRTQIIVSDEWGFDTNLTTHRVY